MRFFRTLEHFSSESREKKAKRGHIIRQKTFMVLGARPICPFSILRSFDGKWTETRITNFKRKRTEPVYRVIYRFFCLKSVSFGWPSDSSAIDSARRHWCHWTLKTNMYNLFQLEYVWYIRCVGVQKDVSKIIYSQGKWKPVRPVSYVWKAFASLYILTFLFLFVHFSLAPSPFIEWVGERSLSLLYVVSNSSTIGSGGPVPNIVLHQIPS